MSNYTILHLHSDLSSCVTSIDSVTKYDEYIERAKECGMKALAFSEHGSVFSWIKKKEHIEAAGMKYIHAEEFYITKTLDEKVRDNRHCILIAKNYDGVLELNRLSSIAFNRNDNHFYYMPRISLDELMSTSDNIIISTACLASPLNSSDDDFKRTFFNFLVENKHRCFLEIQHHNVDEQKRYNIILNKLSKEYGIPLTVGTDTHALNDEHMEARAIMQKAKNVHFENEDAWDLTFKTYDELIQAYEKQNALPMDAVLEAIENTNKIADMVEEFELDRSYKYPHLWDNPEELFMKKIKEGIKKRGVDKYPNRQEYADRVRYELEAYKHNQAIDFMLLMEDICSWCREQDIQVGYGRGSVNGSIIAWLLGITEMDSIKHKLNFDRFLNVERVSLSDVDTDFPPSRIEDVKQYLFNKHGLHCCDIVTFNTIADKGAIRDVGRALSIPLNKVDEICDAVDNEDKYTEVRTLYPELFKYVDMVKGVVVSYGNHPCGTVVCEFTLDDTMGLCSSSTDPYPISQIYMKEIDSLNFVKLDLLKLDTIELIYNTCKMANIPMVTPDNLDITDEKVWESIKDDTTQIFQWEGATGDQYIKRLFKKENLEKFKEVNPEFNQMTLMSIGNSAIRPAGASYREDLAKGIIKTTGSKVIDDFLKDTLGYLTFQETIIFFLHLYCGFTMGEADVVRRGFAKKTGTEQYIPIIKDGGYLNNNGHHIDGFIKTMKDKYGISEEKSEQDITAFLQVIEDASSYLFSLNHSQPYSYMGYASGWLRYYYPVEFLTCALNINSDNQDKTTAITEYADKVGVTISSIQFRYSQGDYSCDPETKTIYKGLGSIKYLSNDLADELYEIGQREQTDFIDLLNQLEETSCDSRQLDILIKLEFFKEFGSINMLLKQVEIFSSLKGRKQLKLADLGKLNIPLDLIQRLAKKQTAKMFSDFDWLELVREMCKLIPEQKTSIVDILKWEQEYLGYMTKTLPNIGITKYFVTDVECKYKNPIITLYRLYDKRIRKIKVKANTFDRNPIEKYDVIDIIKEKSDRKWRMIDGKWTQIDEYEDILEKYQKIF